MRTWMESTKARQSTVHLHQPSFSSSGSLQYALRYEAPGGSEAVRVSLPLFCHHSKLYEDVCLIHRKVN